MSQLILIFFLLFAVQTTTGTQPKQSIQTKINNAIKQYAPNANIGIAVKSLTKNKIIYQKNPDMLFVPASIAKIFPAISALSFLGPNYSFETKILAHDPNIRNGTIKHDIYLYFDGDPTLTHKHIKKIINRLAESGVKRIAGDFHIDDSIFDHEFIGPGWMWEDLNFCYASPISAIIIDKNCLSMKLIAAKKAEQLTTLTSARDHINTDNHSE